MKIDFKLLRVACLIFCWLISSSIFVKAQIHGDNQYKPGTPVMTVEQITRDEKSWATYYKPQNEKSIFSKRNVPRFLQ